MRDLTTTREYQRGRDAWRRQNYIMPGYAYTWQNQAYNLGFNTARNEGSQKPDNFVSVGEAAAKVLKKLKR